MREGLKPHSSLRQTPGPSTPTLYRHSGRSLEMATVRFFGDPSAWGPEAGAPGGERLWAGSEQDSVGHKINKT